MKDSKNLVIGMLCAVICVMAVAYAAFSTTLKVNGTASIDSSWKVAIDSVACPTKTPVTGGAADSVTATATKVSDSVATIDMKFTQPGDTATCTVTYKNSGNLDAVLAHTITGAEGTKAIKFTITGATDKGTTDLLKGTSHTVTVKGEYLSTITGQPETADKTATVQIVSVATQKMS